MPASARLRSALVAAVALVAARAAGSETLDEVLAAARAANARLPVAQADVAIGSEAVREARAALGPRVSVGGDVRYAPGPASYSPAVAPISEERLQLLADQPLYDGGALRARIDASAAQLRAARARYRVAERDLDLEVRARYAEALAVEAELASRRQGLERLRSYLSLVRERMAAGQGLEADRLRTEVRLSDGEANVSDAERRLAGAKLELNDLMGRDPRAALDLAPLPAPSPPAPSSEEPWLAAPDLLQAEADREAAVAGIAEARAARALHLDLTLDAGIFGPGFPFPGAAPSVPARLRDDLGVSLTLSFSWAFWDFGASGARLAQARLKARQAEGSLVVMRRQARLEWERAEADLAALYRTVEIRAAAVPAARDSYVLAESLYRGGLGTSLEVLDAYAALVDAEISHATAVQQYRVAAAQAARWGAP
ncbi:MAG TPA: TolC family protein [Anaeromyxobacter sp.]